MSSKNTKCLICSQVIISENKRTSRTPQNQSNNNKNTSILLNQLSSLLHVSSTAYGFVDAKALPRPLACSSCENTISSAAILQETVGRLEDQLRSLTKIIQKDLIRSYNKDVGQRGGRNGGNELDEVGRLRKTYAQCLVRCEVRLTALESQAGLRLSRSRRQGQGLVVPLKDIMKTEVEEVDKGIEGAEEVPTNDLEGDYWEASEAEDTSVEVPPPSEHIWVVDVQGIPDVPEPDPVSLETDGSEDTLTCEDETEPEETSLKTLKSEGTAETEHGVDEELRFDWSPELEKKQLEFKCKICNGGFPSFVGLYKHRKKNHAGDMLWPRRKNKRSKYSRRFKCDMCNRRFFRESLLEQHLKIHAENSPYFKCTFCTDLFDTPRHLKAHVWKKHKCEKNRFLCNLCGAVFTRNYNLQLHLKLHNGEKDFSCRSCHARFPLVQDLRSHICGQIVNKSKFPCPHCEKSFSRKYARRLHMQLHSGVGIDKKYCQPCNRSFENSADLYHHVKWHAAGCPPGKEAQVEPKYKCPSCNQGYAFKHAFEYHMKKHNNPDELISRHIQASLDDQKNIIGFRCDLCNEAFSQGSYSKNEDAFQILCEHGNCSCNITFTELLAYMAHHSRICTLAYRRSLEGRRLCDECGKEFSNDVYLAKHISRCHSTSEQLTCHVCGKIYGQKSLLETHIANHHSTETPFQCHICGKAFKTKRAASTHLRKVHGYDCNFSCDKCGKKFKTEAYLANHLATHGEAQEPCHLCAKVFKSKAHVWHHVYNTHERRRPLRRIRDEDRKRKRDSGKCVPPSKRKRKQLTESNPGDVSYVELEEVVS